MAIDTGALEAALETVVNPAPAAPAPAPVPQPQAADAPAEVAADEAAPDLSPDDPAPLAEGEAAPEGPEPEFEITYNGQPQKITGREQITELLQKGLDYSQKSEYTNRLQEAIVTHGKAQQEAMQFQTAIIGDIAELQALRQQVAQFDQINWNQAIDADFTNAMKLQEQRNALRAQLQEKEAQINAKAAQFKQAKDVATQQVLQAEQQALLAKLPAWRNSLKAQSEQTKLKSYLVGQGVHPAAIEALGTNMGDHVLTLLARKAWLYDEGQAQKADRLKQARAAPPMVKPGAAQPNTNAIDPNKAKAALVKLGKQGNRQAQEDLAVRLFERAYK